MQQLRSRFVFRNLQAVPAAPVTPTMGGAILGSTVPPTTMTLGKFEQILIGAPVLASGDGVMQQFHTWVAGKGSAPDPSIVQTSTFASTSLGTNEAAVMTLPNPVGEGNAIVVCCSSTGVGTYLGSDNLGNTYVSVPFNNLVNVDDVAGGTCLGVLMAEGVHAGSTTISVNVPTGGYMGNAKFIALEVANVAAVSVLDIGPTDAYSLWQNTGFSPPALSTPVQTVTGAGATLAKPYTQTQQACLLLSVINISGATACTVTSPTGWTEAAHQNDTHGAPVQIQSRFVQVPTLITPGWTTSVAGLNYEAIVFAFRSLRSSAATAIYRPVVYECDSGGVPTVPRGIGAEVTVTANQPAGYVTSAGVQAGLIQSGKRYRLGLHCADGNVLFGYTPGADGAGYSQFGDYSATASYTALPTFGAVPTFADLTSYGPSVWDNATRSWVPAPTFTPARTVPCTNAAQVATALAGLQAGDYVYSPAGIIGLPRLNIYGFLSNWAEIHLENCTIVGNQSGNAASVYIKGTNLRCFFGGSDGSITGIGGGAGIIVQSDETDGRLVENIGIYGPAGGFARVNRTDVGAFFIRPLSADVQKVDAKVSYAHDGIRADLYDPHPERGTGMEGTQISDTDFGTTVRKCRLALQPSEHLFAAGVQIGSNNTARYNSGASVDSQKLLSDFIIYVNAYRIGYDTSGLYWNGGAINNVERYQAPATPDGTMIYDGGGFFDALQQVAGNALQAWGNTDLYNCKFYVWADTCRGRAFDAQGLGSATRLYLCRIRLGRANATNGNPHLGGTEPALKPFDPWDPRPIQLVLQDVI